MSWVETAKLTVERIKKKREEVVTVQEVEELVHGTDCETSELSEKRSIHINKAAELFKKRGWVQIWSTYLNESVYLVRHKSVKVPDPSLPKYTQFEIEALKGLNLEELMTLHEAKRIFRGTIHEK